MTPDEDLDLELELAAAAKRKRARTAKSGSEPREKSSRAAAIGIGAADGATANFTDELVGAGQYLKTMKDQGREVTDPLADVASPLTDLLLFPFGKKPPKKPAGSAEQARSTATADAEREKAIVRTTQDAARKDHPVSYGGGQIAGAVATLPAGGAVGKGALGATKAVGSAAKVVPGAAKAAAPVVQKVNAARAAIERSPMLSLMTKGATAGGTYGAASGAGAAEEDKAGGALEGGLVGAGTGAIGAPVAQGVGNSVGALYQVLKRTAPEKAVATIAKLMRQGKVDPKAAAEEVKRRGRNDTPVFETAAEFMGPKAEGMQTALGHVPGESQKLLAAAFLKSIRGMRKNVTGAAKTAMGKDPDKFHETKAKFAQDQAKRDNEAYRAVEGPFDDPARPPMEGFVEKLFNKTKDEPGLAPPAFRPRFRSYVDEVLTNARKDGDTELANELERFNHFLSEQKAPNRPLTVRAINAIDKRMTQDIERAVARGMNDDARIIGNLQRTLRYTDADTGLGAVRMDTHIGKTAGEAFDKGRKALQPNADLEDLVAVLGDDVPEAIRENTLAGLVRGIDDRLSHQRDLNSLADAANAISATPALRDKLVAALPKVKDGGLTAQSQRFLEMLDRVTNHSNRAKAVMGNSATAARTAAREDAEAATQSMSSDVAEFMAELMTRNPGRISQRLGKWAQNRATRPGIYDPEINEELGKRLSASGKDDVLAVLDEVEKFNTRKIPQLMDPKLAPLMAVAMARRGVDEKRKKVKEPAR